jgi:cytoskeleton protein RodZ
MSEEATTPPDQGDARPLAGERLAALRRTREIPISDIAKQLHLDERKVSAIEQNNFEILGAPVFAKGYLRKYAEIVGVPNDDILADYYRLNRSTGMPLVIHHPERQPRDIALGPWLAGIAVVAVIAGAAWWWLSTGAEWFANRSESDLLAPFMDDRPEVSGETGEVEQPTVPSGAAPPLPADAVSETGDTGSAGTVTDAAEPETQSAAPPATVDSRTTVQLRVAFTGDCWTEVTDAMGERLFFGLGSAGRDVTLEGEPPLQVLLGNSANATLEVNGSSYAIPRSARRGDTARLTITNP